MKTKIKRWKISALLLFLSSVYGLYFIYAKSIPRLIILFLLLTASGIYFYYCTKQITLPGGYTAVQAQRFYRACSERGFKSRNALRENEDLLKEIAKKYDFAANLDTEGLLRLYSDGRSVDSAEDKKQ